MNDWLIKIVTNDTFLTIISGVLVFILGQIFIELCIYPRRNYKAIKQKVIYSLSLYKYYYSNPYNLMNEKANVRDKNEYVNASRELRILGSELSGYLANIPKFRVIKIKKIKKAVDALIGISNGFFIISNTYNPIKDTFDFEKDIKDAFDLKY